MITEALSRSGQGANCPETPCASVCPGTGRRPPLAAAPPGHSSRHDALLSRFSVITGSLRNGEQGRTARFASRDS